MSSQITAILIDPFEKTTRTVRLRADQAAAEARDLIGTQATVFLNLTKALGKPSGLLIVEGMGLRRGQEFFTFVPKAGGLGTPLGGKAVFVWLDSQGAIADCPPDLAEAGLNIRWLPFDAVSRHLSGWGIDL